MDFKDIDLSLKEQLNKYLYRFGNNSCQYSFAQMLGLKMKYHDQYAIDDNVLYIHRKLRDTDGKRVYLAPLGVDCHDENGFTGAIDRILKDALQHNSKVIFETVTESCADMLAKCYPGVFDITADRNMSEYVYLSTELYDLPGRGLSPKRNRVRAFYNAYDSDDISIECINMKNIEDVKIFQEEWMAGRRTDESYSGLETENEAIKLYLDKFDYLDFSGIVVYVNGTVAGYAAGVPLSDSCMDEVIEKGRHDVIGIYQVLCREFAGLAKKKYEYINREEDIGSPGLRRAKESYMPYRLIDKYVVNQK